MNKKASVISIDKNLCDLLYKSLQKEKKKTDCIIDLMEGLKDFSENQCESLIINFQTDKEKVSDIVSAIKLGDLKIDWNNRSVYHNENSISLTPKEFEILYFLAKNKGRIYCKNEIYNNVWKEEYNFDDSNIMAHIRKLRKKIEPNPNEPIYILTVWGVGYKFNGDIL